MSQQASSILSLTMAAITPVAANRFVSSFGVPAIADQAAIGVANAAAVLGEKFPVTVKGTAIVEAGAAITAGATLKSDASGRAITWVTSGAKVGYALEAASAAGQLIEVVLLDNA